MHNFQVFGPLITTVKQLGWWMLHMGKSDQKAWAFSAGSCSEPVSNNRDVSGPLPPSAALAFSSLWARDTSFLWHTASLASACKLWALVHVLTILCFLNKREKANQHTKPHQTHGGFPLPQIPYTRISSISIDWEGLLLTWACWRSWGNAQVSMLPGRQELGRELCWRLCE